MSKTAFSEILAVEDDTRNIPYQLTTKDDGLPVDISGWTFTFGAKEEPEDAAEILGPIAGVISDAANGKFSFEVPFTPVFVGVYEVIAIDGSANKLTLTPGNGVKIQVVDKIVE